MSHISKSIIGTLGDELEGKTILHCITSSISCYLAPQISRLLMRHGANVIPILSPEAAKFINPLIFKWATGNDPVEIIEGDVEHVQYAGLSENKADLVLIAPITANSLSKIANGIMDTAVTLVAGTALGNNIPLIVVPTMHEVMLYNPAVEENIEKLQQIGVQILMPKIEEEKAKIPTEQEIISNCLRTLSNNEYQDVKVLVTAGPTRAYLDGIRFISNPSTGKMGYNLAFEAWRMGAEVELVYGYSNIDPSSSIKNKIKVEEPEEMYEHVIKSMKDKKHEIVILAAAMNDFALAEPLDEKVKSREEWDLILKPTKKLADEVKKVAPDCKLVLFKAEYKKSDQELVEIAKERMKKANADFIVANEVSKKKFGFASNYNKVAIIQKDSDEVEWVEGTKKLVAKKILEKIK